MALFRATDRKNIMDYIVSFAEQYEHILALVAVGSGSFGYIDELSDLDMVMAIDSNENMENVMEYVVSQLNKRLSFIFFKQMPQRRLQVYLSDNYLEICLLGCLAADIRLIPAGEEMSINSPKLN